MIFQLLSLFNDPKYVNQQDARRQRSGYLAVNGAVSLARLAGNAMRDGCSASASNAPIKASSDICSSPAVDHPLDVASQPMV
jgi:hypothetical protein